jgi:hypothetical protein
VEEISFRSDSAAYEHEVLNWCRDEADIIFAISADMSPELREAITALPEEEWSHLDRTPKYLKTWAEVEFIPSAPSYKKGRRPDGYLAIRIKPRQGNLFSDGSEVKYFAVVTNDWERSGPELIRWHRQKAGTIEKLHLPHPGGQSAGAVTVSVPASFPGALMRFGPEELRHLFLQQPLQHLFDQCPQSIVGFFDRLLPKSQQILTITAASHLGTSA